MKAKIFSRLFYRHWNAFTEFKRRHLFVMSADANSSWRAELCDAGRRARKGSPLQVRMQRHAISRRAIMMCRRSR